MVEVKIGVKCDSKKLIAGWEGDVFKYSLNLAFIKKIMRVFLKWAQKGKLFEVIRF